MQELKDFLDKKCEQYNKAEFIETDPILIPHQFSGKLDIEVAGFLTALLSWGNRRAIQKACFQLMKLMDNKPHDFVVNHSSNELSTLQNFYYRTFQKDDAPFYIKALKNIYLQHGGIEQVFF